MARTEFTVSVKWLLATHTKWDERPAPTDYIQSYTRTHKFRLFYFASRCYYCPNDFVRIARWWSPNVIRLSKSQFSWCFGVSSSTPETLAAAKIYFLAADTRRYDTQVSVTREALSHTTKPTNNSEFLSYFFLWRYSDSDESAFRSVRQGKKNRFTKHRAHTGNEKENSLHSSCIRSHKHLKSNTRNKFSLCWTW